MTNEFSNFIDEMLRLSSNKLKIEFELVLKAYAKIFPQEYFTEGNRNEKIMNVLHQLANINLINLPAGKRHWNYSYQPAVPTWIKITQPKSRGTTPWKKYPWHPRLIWASQLQKIQLKGFQSLKKLNDFFIQLGDRSLGIIPIKERSYQIFGNEKELENLLNRDWFRRHLTIEDLGCFRTFEPFASKTYPSPPNGKTIILENRDTFNSFCKVNAQISPSLYQYIIYGEGNKIEKSILWIKEFDPTIQTIEYFGDIDLNGLVIPHRANNILIENEYPQRIELAQIFYSRLIEIAKSRVFKISEDSTVAPKIHSLLKSLSANDQIYANLVLHKKERIPQELLNFEEILDLFYKINQINLNVG